MVTPHPKGIGLLSLYANSTERNRIGFLSDAVNDYASFVLILTKNVIYKYAKGDYCVTDTTWYR